MRLIFNIACLVTIGTLVTLAIWERGKPWGALAILLGAAALTGLIANSDRIQSIGIPNVIEAKTRDLQEVLDKARVTVAQLHQLAIITAEQQVDMLAAMGRWGPSQAYREAKKRELLDRLKSLGLNDDEIHQVSLADRHWVMIDYNFGILKPLSNPKEPAQQAAYTDVFKAGNPLTPDECEALLKKFGIDNAQSNALLSDYRYYMKTGKQQRPDVWENRQW